MARGLRAGRSFAGAARDAGLPDAHVATLEAAEVTGTLDRALAELATSLEAEAAIRREGARLLLRPTILVAAAALLVPLPRLVTTGVASYVKFAVPLLVGVVVVGMLFRAALDAMRSGDRTLAGSLPGVDDLVALAARARACRALGLMLGAGLPLPRALRLAGALGGPVIGPALQNAANDVEGRGAGLSEAFERAGVLTGLYRVALVDGEVTGRLDRTMPRVATLIESDIESRMQWRLRILAVVTYLAVAFVAAWQAASTFRLIGTIAE
jgi:type II secretory pathway component PulF